MITRSITSCCYSGDAYASPGISSMRNMSITITRYRVFFVIKLFWSNGFLDKRMLAFIIVLLVAAKDLHILNALTITLDLLPTTNRQVIIALPPI
jgi:hypothetical protein